MRAAKVDANQAEVIEEILTLLPGCTVQSLAGVGKGVPDILVGWKKRFNFLFEIKDPGKIPSKRKLNEWQAEWHGKWQGPVWKIETAAEAVGLIADFLTTHTTTT